MINYVRGDVMKKISLAIILCLIGFSLVACEQGDNEQVDIEEYTYESPYTKGYNFPHQVLNEVYYDYHDIFAGVYLVDNAYNINITKDAPQIIITKLEQNSSVTHHIVNFSFAELWTVREIVTSYVIEMEGFSGVGISEMDNTVRLTLITDTEIPESFNHYIEIGILTIDFQDTHTTF